MSDTIARLLKNQLIIFKCAEKYRSTNLTPVLVYDVMMDISAKLTLESVTGQKLLDSIKSHYEENESPQATDDMHFTRVVLMLQQYVLVEQDILGSECKGVLQRITPMFGEEEICGYQVEIISRDFVTRVSGTFPIGTISENLRQVDRGADMDLPI
ncbi:hypothetical protein VN97_g6586 [Penicillium thymicola]|uniref:Uncharacterized protein n=1 Tax=Penicillium thymicola TaxID=293382 RepID=A0AAI9X7L2_PENTH|nr:hypothetical protein VN97_g6586 [Penicillium thymicola]